MDKQVNKQHYAFQSYISKARWNSFWHQIDEVLKLNPHKILEIGPEPGLFKDISKLIGLHVETLDIDPELNPDYIGSAKAMPFKNAEYDVVCAFQMLEHLPYDEALAVFDEMVRCSKNNIIISLPDCLPDWHYKIYIPKFGAYEFNLSRPFRKLKKHQFDGQHYWEINKEGYHLNKIIKDFSKGVNLIKTYRVKDNPYHRFFIFSRSAI